jgi:prevent-host-death family protein
MKYRTVGVTEFKANCVPLLDQVAREGGTITVTKRGRPLATLGQAKRKPFRSSEGILAGKGRIIGDIVNADTADLWEVVTNPDRVLNPEKYR